MLVLEQGLRADPHAAKAFLASSVLRHLTLDDYRQRMEATRMFGHPLAGVPVQWFSRGLKSYMLPRLEYVAKHAYAPHSASLALRLLERLLPVPHAWSAFVCASV